MANPIDKTRKRLLNAAVEALTNKSKLILVLNIIVGYLCIQSVLLVQQCQAL